MSTTDPTGDGGGGPASMTPTDDNVTPVTPSTGIAISPGSHHHQHPPPSPLSGCYLLVVLPEPHTAQHRDLILNRLAKGFLSWDKDSCHVDLEKELQALVAQAPEGEEARNGERLIQYATENLVTEVLIHPQTNTLLQCIRNLLASFTKHRHIIHAGYTFSGNGSWILQDGTFSLADFLDAFGEHEVQRVLRAYENSVTVDINCAGVGEWSTARLSKEACTRSCRVRLNPDDVLTAGVPAITSFTSYVGQYLVSQTLDQLMEPSDVVGNIRFSHPTLYVFPGGQGDAALFGINGFNMLVDGGFARKACFWDFARHLDRLDAVLITRINNSNVGGMSSVLRKKREMHVYPQIGHFFCNLIERRHLNSPDGDKDLDPLILNLTDIGHEMMVDLRHINLRAHPCYRDPNPINLYHKVGHGTLDMYVLSPSKDSREVREFLTKWHASDSKLFSGSSRKDSNNLTFPIQNLASICALLVWQPANPEDTITRILFPGSTPQHKIFEGIERLKHLEFLKHPVCTAKSLSPSTSLLALKDRPTIKQKLGLFDESKKPSDAKKDKRDLPDSKLSKTAEEHGSKPTPQGTPINQAPKVQLPKIDVKTKKVIENKKIESESKKIEKDLKEIKKDAIKKDVSTLEKDSEIRKLEGYRIKMDNEKMALMKESKAKLEPKRKEIKESKPVKIGKTEPSSKPFVKIPDKKQKLPSDKKDLLKASPPTPKKSLNGAATKVELTRVTSRPTTKPSSKQLLSTMPAKSAKDANNRKVVEQKNIEIASAGSTTMPAVAKLPTKQKASERKPIGRRTKPVSPIKARIPISPTKSTRSTPTTSVKSDKDGIIRKIKGDRGTTDSSTVSTPSGIDIDSMNKLADKCLTEKSEDMSLDSIESKVLADLKEEREVVEEIEAVLQKAERIEGTRRDDHLDGDDDITAEATDKKEDDMTEDDVTADIEELPKKESSRKTSHELTEEDEYLIIEKEEIYIEDSVQSGEGEEKHVLNVVETKRVEPRKDIGMAKEEEEEQQETEISEEKEKTDIPEKQLRLVEENLNKTESEAILPSPNEELEEQMRNIISSATELGQKAEDKDDSGKKDSEDITKEPSSLSPDKLYSSEKKTSDTDIKPEIDRKDQQVPEKLEESHERISTLESGATTTAPTLPEDERIPLDEIKEVIDEKYIGVQEKKSDSAIQVQEPPVAQIATEPKPDAKAFEVHPPLHGIQREVVKTPDEVADLPVHEEVDPTLYHMEHFEKAKEEKPGQTTVLQQEIKELETPPVKEQKGVFSFFGKVADKFEKGIDKLTGKSRRDSEKDIDEKSSSKSGSPKEVKSQSITGLNDAEVKEINTVFEKVAEASRVPEIFEKGTPEISKIKVAAIKDTATFLKEELEDLKESGLPAEESKETDDKLNAFGDKPVSKAGTEAGKILDPVFETCVVTDKKNNLEGIMTELDVEEDAEDVEALLKEASEKFKTVKDSLHDSLESLEEIIADQEMIRAESVTASKDFVKDTLSELAEKLEDIKPHDEHESPDEKELEKVKFEVLETKGYDDEKREVLATVTKDLKEAVRDVGEVLAGSAGILIEEKPKDVVEIVKKVAEVLKADDFLSPDVLLDTNVSRAEDEAGDDEGKSEKLTMEVTTIPKKVSTTEELLPQEVMEKMPEDRDQLTTSLMTSEPAGHLEIHEYPCVKTTKADETRMTSPVGDAALDKTEAMQICADVMKDEHISSKQKGSDFNDPSKSDVMEVKIASIAERKIEDQPGAGGDHCHVIEEPKIIFDRKVSPATAEVVMVTPDLSPTSAKLSSDKVDIKEIETRRGMVDSALLPSTNILNVLHNEGSLENMIEDLIFMKKVKITFEIIEYITTIRTVPREEVIYIIEEIIVKNGASPESVIADLNLFKPDAILNEKREEIERYINEEYIMKNKQITMTIVENISIENFISKRNVINIITELIVKKKIPCDKFLDISVKEYSQLHLWKEDIPGQNVVSRTSEISGAADVEAQETTSPTVDQYSDIKKFIEDDLIAKGQKITTQLIDDVCIAKIIPKRIFVGIIEKIITERNIPRSSMFNVSEKELSDLLASEKDLEAILEPKVEKDQAEKTISISPEKRLEVIKYITDEFVTKKDKITPCTFKTICVRNNVSEEIIVEIIEEIIAKHKLPRESIFDISNKELSELLAVGNEKIAIESTTIDSDEKLLKEDSRKLESVTLDRSDIENSIVEEFVLTNKRITPYIFEDICIRYKVPRRMIIEIIEEIIVKRNIARNSFLDITDTELSELLTVVEAEGEEENSFHVEPIAKETLTQDDVDEDKLLDGFVAISSKDDILTKNIPILQSVEPAFKESEKDVDDFEAVEQEYKIHGLPVTPDNEVILNVHTAKSDHKIGGSTEDTIEDHVSDVVEAKETMGGGTPVIVPTTITERKSEDIPGLSEIGDTTEKYLIEAKEKPEVNIFKQAEPLYNLVDDIKLSEVTPKKVASEISDGIPSNIQEIGTSKDSVVSNDFVDAKQKSLATSVKELTEYNPENESLEIETSLIETVPALVKTAEEMNETVVPKVDTGIVTAVKKPSIVKLNDEQESKEQESKHKSPTTQDKIDIPEVIPDKKDTVEQLKDKFTIKDPEEVASKIESVSSNDMKCLEENITDETTLSSSTVRRMVVTASSEDGGEETEVCPSGSIIFTPDDSLKSSPTKTPPDQDSLRLNKESLHSDVSTPERDSISDKSTIGTKDGGKITPEDSLDRSPSGTRDSQDLEDSLDKSDLTKLKETEIPKPLMEESEDTVSRRSSTSIKAIDEKCIEMIKSSEFSTEADTKVPTATISEDGSSVENATERPTLKQKDLTPIVMDLHPKALSAKPLSHLNENEKEVADTALTSIEIDDKVDDESQALISGGKFDQEFDLQQPAPRSRESSTLSEKSIHDHTGSPISSTINAKEVGDKKIDNKLESSSVSGKEQIEESDIIKKSSSIVSILEPCDLPSTVSIMQEKTDEKGMVDTFYSIGSASEKEDALQTVGSLRMPRMPNQVDEVHDEIDMEETVDKSRVSLSDSEQLNESGTEDACTLPNIDGSKHDGKRNTDEQDILDQSKTLDSVGYEDSGFDNTRLGKLESPSTSVGEHDKKEPLDRSIPLTASNEKLCALVLKDSVDTLQSSGVVGVEDELALIDHSKSPSVAGHAPSEGQVVDIQNRSKTPTTSGINMCEGESTNRSTVSGITPDQDDGNLTTYIQDGTVAIDSVTTADKELSEKHQSDQSSSPEIVAERQDENESKDHLISSSVDAEDHGGKDQINRSRSPSGGIEKQDEKQPVEFRSSSITAVEHGDEKVIDHSRSSSFSREMEGDQELIRRARSPSITSEEPEEKKANDGSVSTTIISEIQAKKEMNDNDRSPSTTVTKVDAQEPIDRSLSSSIASKTHDEIGSVHRSRSSSITSEKQLEEEPIRGSRSPSIAAETPEGKELISRSRSSSTVSEKHSGKKPIGRSRSPSTATEKQHKKESIDPSRSRSSTVEKEDEKELIDRSRSPSSVSETREGQESVGRSMSFSTAAEKQDEKESLDHSSSPSVTGEKQDEGDSMDRSRSPITLVEKKDGKELMDRFITSIATVEKQDDNVSLDKSRSSSIVSEKPNENDWIDRSRPPIATAEKQDSIEAIERSRSSSDAAEKQEQESFDRSKSPSIAAEMQHKTDSMDDSRSPISTAKEQDGKESIDRSRSSSVAAEKRGEQESETEIDRSRSPSVAAEKCVEQESETEINRSRSPSVAAEKFEERESGIDIDRSRSSSIAAEKRAEHESITDIDRSRSPSVAAEKRGEQESGTVIDWSRSPSLTTEKRVEQESETEIDHSRSPSVAAEKLGEQESETENDRSRSPGVAGEKREEQESGTEIDRSRSSSVAAEKLEEHQSRTDIERSRSPSVAAEKRGEQESGTDIDRSRSSSVAAEKLEERESRTDIDRSRSPSVAAEKRGDEESGTDIDRSRSSSVAAEKHEEQELGTEIDRSRSPSVAGEKREEPKSVTKIDRSGSLSISADESKEQGSGTDIDRSRSPSVAAEKRGEQESGTDIDRSRSSSVAAEKHAEQELGTEIDRSRSPSIAAEKCKEQESGTEIDRSRSSSVAAEKLEEHESRIYIDRSRSPSVAAEKRGEQESGTDIDRSRSSFSVAAEKHGQQELGTEIDRSRSPSVAAEKCKEQESGTEIDRSRSSSVAAEKLEEHESRTDIDRSRSRSVAAEKHGEQESGTDIDRSRSSSVAAEKHGEKELGIEIDRSRSPSVAAEKCKEQESGTEIDRSRSSSVGAEKLEEHESRTDIDRSRSPSVAAEKHGEQESRTEINRSRSSSVAAEKHAEQELGTEIDRSRSPSIAAEKCKEQESGTEIDRSRSSSVAAEKLEEHESRIYIDRSRSPSVAAEKRGEQESGTDIDRSRSSFSVAAEKHGQQELGTEIDRSRSPSVAAEKCKEQESGTEIDRSRSSSVAAEKLEEHESRTDIDRSRSPSVAAEKHGEQESGTDIDRSRSSSVAAEKHGEKELGIEIDRSRSPSVAAEKCKKQESGTEIDRSRSSSVAAEKLEEHESRTDIDRSRSPSVAAEKHGEQESGTDIDRSRSSSVAAEKHGEKELGIEIDRSRSPSVAAEKSKEQESGTEIDRSRSSSVAAEKLEEHESRTDIDRSRSPSVAAEKHGEQESGTDIDRSRSSSIAAEKHEEKELGMEIDRSRSPSVAAEKSKEQESGTEIDRSRSSSVAAEKLEEHESRTDIDRSRSPSVAAEKHGEQESGTDIDRSRSSSVAAEKHGEKELGMEIDRSRSPSIAAEKSKEQESGTEIDRSRSSSVAAEELEEHQSRTDIERSRSPSVAAEKRGEQESGTDIDRSRSSSVAAEKLEEHQSKTDIERSRSPSVAAEKRGEQESGTDIDRSRSPSVAAEKHGEQESGTDIDRSRSSSVAAEKLEEHESRTDIDRSRSPSVAATKREEQDSGTDIDRSRSPSVAAEKREEHESRTDIDRSRSPSVVAEKRGEQESGTEINRSRSPSVAAEECEEQESGTEIDRFGSLSVAAETHVEQDLRTEIDRSRSPSVAAEKRVERESVTENDRSRSSSLAAEKREEQELGTDNDRSRSPSVAAEKRGEQESGTEIYRSRSSSVAAAKCGEQESGTEIDRSRSPSIAAEKRVEQESGTEIDRFRSSRVAAEKREEQESGTEIDRSRSPSVAAEKRDEKESGTEIDRSRSPSVAAEKHDAKKSNDHSRSPSVADEEQDEKNSVDHSRSPSIVGEKQAEKDPSDNSRLPSSTDENQDKIESIDRSVSLSTTAEKREKRESIDHSRSPSIAAEKHDEIGLSGHTKPIKTTGETQEEEDSIDRLKSFSSIAETQDGKELINTSRSPSATPEEQEKRESIDCSWSPSIAAEKHDGKELIDHSRSPGLADKNQDQKDSSDHSRLLSSTAEMQNENEAIDRSSSSSTAAEKREEEKSIYHSRSPSIATEKHDEDESTNRSRSPSIAAEKLYEKVSTAEKQYRMVPTDESISLSPTAQKGEEQESILRSSSLNIAAEIEDNKDSVDHFRSPSSMAEKQDGKGPTDLSETLSTYTEKREECESIGHLRLSSISAQEHDEKESIDCSIASKNQDEKDFTDRSSSSGTAADKHDEMESISRSKLPSMAIEKQGEKEATDRSRSPGTTAEKQDACKPIDNSRSSSTTADQLDTMVLVDRSRSASIDSEKQYEKERTVHSGTPSIDDGKQERTEPIDHCRSPSITSENQDGGGLIGSSKSSITDQYDLKNVLGHSRSASFASEKLDEKAPADPSRSSSIASEKQGKEKLIDPCKSPDILSPDPAEPLDEIQPFSITTQKSEIQLEDSRSPSIASERQDEKQLIDGSRSPIIDDDKSAYTSIAHASIVDGKSSDFRKDTVSSTVSVQDSKLDATDAVQALQKLAETIADKSAETEYGRKLQIGETTQHDNSKDRSRSHSLFDADERTLLGRSRTASLFEDKVPEVKRSFQEPETKYIYDENDQATIAEKNILSKTSLNEIPDDEKDLMPSDSEKFDATKFEDTLLKQTSAGIAGNIAAQFTEECHAVANDTAKVKEYIVNNYIIKEEKITPQIVDEITTLYSMSRYMILELIEAIIVEKNVPRDLIVNFSKDEAFGSDVVCKDDHVDVIDIPTAKRHEIESYILEECVSKTKKITSEVINELAALTHISRHIIITVIKEIIMDRKALMVELIEDGILDESRTNAVQSAVNNVQSTERESVRSYGSTMLDDRQIEDHSLPSISTNFTSHPNLTIDKESLVSEQKRIEIETYIMEECVKKGIKITGLVLEQIITRMGISRSVLLGIIENIIVTRKMSRTGMLDDAIYDEVNAVTCKSVEQGLSPGTEKATLELVPDKNRLVEFSGKSTPETKSSGNSTPEVQQYHEKFGNVMSSYSNDYESPFHKAFVGGMTEIRTTHITTLSGKSTPDYSVRGETPESLSDSVTSSTQVKSEEKSIINKDTASHKYSLKTTATVTQAPIIFTTDITLATTTATISTAFDSKTGHPGTSVPSDKVTTWEILPDDHGTVEKQDMGISEKEKFSVMPDITKMASHEIHREEEPEVNTTVIRTKIIEKEEPVIERKIIRKEVIIEEKPQIITKIIQHSIIDSVDESIDDYEVPKTSRSSLEASPESTKSITLRTTDNIVTEDPHYEDPKVQVTPETVISKTGSMHATEDVSIAGNIGGDIETTITTVKTLTESNHRTSSHETLRGITDVLKEGEASEKVMHDSCTKTETTNEVTNATPIEFLKTEEDVTDTIETTTLLPATSTPGIQTSFDSDMPIADCTSVDEKSVGRTHSEKIILEKQEHPISPIIKDLISDQRSYSGRISPDIPVAKDLQSGSATGKSTTDMPSSALIRECAVGHSQISGRSTPDKRPTSRSSTATPEGLRSNEVIRTTITTTRTMSEEGDIITTTMEITETTNEKGETTILAEKTDVKVEDRILPTEIGKSTFTGGLEGMKVPTDLLNEADVDPVSPRSDHSSLHSRAGTHVWGSSEERHTYSDEEVPGSPLSTTSQFGYSPQSTYHFGEHSFAKGSSHKSMEFSETDMSSSFYGELPDLPPRVTTMKMVCSESSGTEASGESAPIDSDFSFKKSTVEEVTHLSNKEKSGSKKCIDDADLDFEKALMERKEIKRDRELTSVVDKCPPNGSSSSQSLTEGNKVEQQVEPKKDPLTGWDTPLGLPSPKPPRKFNLRTTARTNPSSEVSQDSINFDPINDWGEPLRLPSPAAVTDEASNKAAPSTPKKERKQPKKVISENMKNRKRSESPAKNEKKSKDTKSKIQPVYMDLTYVPHHGNSYYTSVEFFKRVRARYYVFSGTEPSREVYDALLDAKKTWEDKDLEVTMIPTYDTDTLGYWVADNEEALAANHIDLSPSAARCTINLQDHETSCSAYRLEF